MIKKINLPCIFCGSDRTTVLSVIFLNKTKRKWCSSSCPNCQVLWIKSHITSPDAIWWSPQQVEQAILFIEKYQNWKLATEAFDRTFNTSYSQTAHKTTKGEYRSGFKKKFEYMPELDWDPNLPDQKLVDMVIDAMSEEKKRRGTDRFAKE